MCYIQIGPTKTAPLLISPIEMRVLWTEIKYTKSAARLLDRVWVNKRGLDLSKEVLWVFSAERPGSNPDHPRRAVRQNFFKPPTLMAGSSAVLWPKKTHSTSLERSKPPLLTQTLSKSLAALLVYFISVQSTLISIGFISKGAVFVRPICNRATIIQLVRVKIHDLGYQTPQAIGAHSVWQRSSRRGGSKLSRKKVHSASLQWPLPHYLTQ